MPASEKTGAVVPMRIRRSDRACPDQDPACRPGAPIRPREGFGMSARCVAPCTPDSAVMLFSSAPLIVRPKSPPHDEAATSPKRHGPAKWRLGGDGSRLHPLSGTWVMVADAGGGEAPQSGRIDPESLPLPVPKPSRLGLFNCLAPCFGLRAAAGANHALGARQPRMLLQGVDRIGDEKSPRWEATPRAHLGHPLRACSDDLTASRSNRGSR